MTSRWRGHQGQEATAVLARTMIYRRSHHVSVQTHQLPQMKLESCPRSFLQREWTVKCFCMCACVYLEWGVFNWCLGYHWRNTVKAVNLHWTRQDSSYFRVNKPDMSLLTVPPGVDAYRADMCLCILGHNVAGSHLAYFLSGIVSTHHQHSSLSVKVLADHPFRHSRRETLWISESLSQHQPDVLLK